MFRDAVWTGYERRSRVQRVTEMEMIVMWARLSRVKRARIVFEVCRKGKANQLEMVSQRWTV